MLEIKSMETDRNCKVILEKIQVEGVNILFIDVPLNCISNLYCPTVYVDGRV
jgi:hypothetical protein